MIIDTRGRILPPSASRPVEKKADIIKTALGYDDSTKLQKHLEQPAFNLALMRLLIAKGVIDEPEARALHKESEEAAQHLATFTSGSLELALLTYEGMSTLTEEQAEQHVLAVVGAAAWLVERYRGVLAEEFCAEMTALLEQAKEINNE